MSLALATKGIISRAVRGGPGGAYPVYIYVYVPTEEPDVDTERLGDKSMFTTSYEPSPRSKELEPAIRAKELKPKMKAE
jgi:hypothetical protein